MPANATRLHRPPRAWRLLVAALVALVLVTACGGDDEADPDEVASLDGGSGGDADATRRRDVEAALLDFTGCLRDEGVEVPDIPLDAEGAPIIRPDDVSGLDLNSPEFVAAFDDCIHILNEAGAFSFDFDPTLQAILQDQLHSFARCMRGEGVTDFPDPDPDAVPPFPITAFADFPQDYFQDALTVCRGEIGEGLNG